MPEYTDDDIAHAVREYKDIQRDMETDEYDGPIECMFSFGYGFLWADGDVTAFGRVVFKVNEDGEVQ